MDVADTAVSLAVVLFVPVAKMAASYQSEAEVLPLVFLGFFQ